MRGTRINPIQLTAIAAVLAAMVAAPAGASSGSSGYTIWTIAGTSVQCTTPPACADGQPAAAARLSLPEAVAVDPRGDVYIADYGDSEIRRVTPTGQISLIAGTGTSCQKPPSCGDGGQATAARLSFPAGVAVDSKGNVYVADTGDNEVRKISPSGVISRIAGTGSPCARPPACGDGSRATSAALTDPTGLALDSAGNLYIADSGDQEIRKVSPSGVITRLAGNGIRCAKPPSCGDAGPATSAQLNFPEAVALGRAGVVYVADSGDQEIRKIASGGTITTVAGTGATCASPPSCGDGGAATSGTLSFPNGVALTPAGNLLIADSSDNEVREVVGGKIQRVAGTGSPCAKPPACGDNLAASAARLDYPTSVAVDARGNIYVSDSGDNEVRWLSAVHAGHISTASGFVGLGAFSATVTKGSVIVRYVLGRPANVELTVRHAGHSETAVTAHAHAGFNELTRNRRVRGKPAPKGGYTLILSGAIGHASASSTLHVQL
jgi:sugar lactone lactonase YvrE